MSPVRPAADSAYGRAYAAGRPAVRRLVLDAASRLLEAEGPEALTMRRIAAEAGCSTSVLYTSASANNLSESLFVNLPTGNYFAHVMSAADPTASNYYDIGSYFLTGSFAVPEPSMIAFVMVTAVCGSFARRRRRI